MKLTLLEIKFISNPEESILGDSMMRVTQDKLKDGLRGRLDGAPEVKEVKGVGERIVLQAYGSIFPKIKKELNDAGVFFNEPKILVNERELQAKDYWNRRSIMSPLPYYYVQFMEHNNALYYSKEESGFYHVDKKAIVIDWTRIKNNLERQKESEFGAINGVNFKEADNFIKFQVERAVRKNLSQHILEEKKMSRELKAQVKELLGLDLVRSMRKEWLGEQTAEKLFDRIWVGMENSAEFIIDSFLLKRTLSGILKNQIPDDNFRTQNFIHDNFDGRFGLLRNIYANELKYERKEWEAKHRQESLERSSGDYIDFSPYPYHLHSDVAGVFFAATLLKKNKEKSVLIASDPQKLVEAINGITKKELSEYNVYDYYSPPLNRGGGHFYLH